MVLRNFDEFLNRRFYDIDKHLLLHKTTEDDQGVFYRCAQEVIVTFYRNDDKLFISAPDFKHEITDFTSINMNQSDRNTEVTVIEKSENVGEFHYPKSKPMEYDDPTPFLEEEDFDFALFLKNVLEDPNRKQLIFR